MGFADIVYGPENFMSQNGELTAATKTIDLGDNLPGKYLIKIQNGLNGPALLKQCENKSTIELKRQCQYDNLVDRIENNLTRADRLFITINGKKVSNKTIISKGTSYLEFPVQLNQAINALKFEVQGSPESVVSISIEEIETQNLPPRALFTINSNHGRAPFKINFNAGLSFDPLNSAISYQWFNGSSQISSAKSGSFTFNTAGTYHLKLKVKNALNEESELDSEIVVLTAAACNPNTNKKPIAKITVSNPDPLNLRKVKISSDGSTDPDGMITNTEIDFGDGFKVSAAEAIHEYVNDGTYIAKVKVTDNLGAKSAIEKSIAVVLSNELTKIGSILGPKKYYGSFSSYAQYIENINIPNDQIQDLFKITIKNADGLDHPILKCTGTLSQKIMCNYNNWLSRAYIALYRVNWAQIYINNKKITDSVSINKNKIYFETYLKLTEVNQLKIKVKGWPTAFIDVEIEQLGQQRDMTAPVLTSNLPSNSITNQSLVHISIADNSSVSTQIFKDGVLQSTTTEKEFDLTLVEGINNFTLKSTDSANNAAPDFVLSQMTLDTVAPELTSGHKKNYFFKTLPQNIEFLINANEILQSLMVDQVPLSKNSDGAYIYTESVTEAKTFNHTIQATDLVGNITTQDISYYSVLDNTAPIVTIGAVPALTNLNEVLVSFVVSDDHATSTIVKVNGAEVAAVNEINFSYLLMLPTDGINTIEVVSTDKAGNVSDTAMKQIIKDSTPPILSQILPSDGSTIAKMKFNVSGISNEELSVVSVNGLNLSLGLDKKSFTGQYIASELGTSSLLIIAKDLLGNEVQLNNSVNITNALLNSQLVTVTPSADGLYYYITGRAGASRAEASISANTGIFSTNKGSDTANSDGSFAIKMSRFTKATVKAVDNQTSEESSFVLNFYVPTSIAGIVKDYNNNPLPGATVRIIGTTLLALTDASGIFSVNDVPVGDQILSIDGSTIPQTTTGVNRKFYTNNLAISISPGINNTLSRPIYLVPTDIDGTATQVISSQNTIVTNPNAPGVTLNLPAGTARFPNGSSSGIISVREIPADRAAMPVLQNAVPDTVFSFQPSGTKFTQRVEVSFPNTNDLTPGEEAYVLSLNSLSGQWEINGIAKVSNDGSQITTKPGFGITHFSDMHVVPAKPYFESMQDPNLDGINVAKGGFETSVPLPSYKSLGLSVTPALKYNSSWSNPTAFVTNGFAVPKQEILYENSNSTYTSDSKQVPLLPICVSGDLCPTRQILIEQWVDQKYQLEQGFIPDSISSQTWVGVNAFDEPNYILESNNQNINDIAGIYLSNSIKTEKWTIVNDQAGTLIPNYSQISYSLPLRKSTGEYFSTGIYPSMTRYEVKLKHLTIRTVTTRVKVKVEHDEQAINTGGFVNGVKVERNIYTDVLQNIFPKDVQSKLIVQNKSNSVFGSGWEFDPTQKILNHNSSQLLIEEPNGAVSTYTAGFRIETLFNSNGTKYDLTYGAGLNSWPNLFIQKYDTDRVGRIYKVDAVTGSETLQSTLADNSGITGFDNFDNCGNPNFPQTVSKYKMKFTTRPGFSNILQLGDGTIIGASTTAHSLVDLSTANSQLIGGAALNPANGSVFDINQSGANFGQKMDITCGALNLDCYELTNLNTTSLCSAGLQHHDESGTLMIASSFPNWKSGATNDWQTYANGNLVTSRTQTDGFNKPSGMALSPDGRIAIADTGNNVVLLYNQQTKMTKVIAGDFYPQDDGDGDQAAPNVIFDVVKNQNIREFLVKNNLINLFYELIKSKTSNALVSYLMPPASSIYHPKGLAYDSLGNLYISSENGFIRKVDVSGVITTYAGRTLENGGTLSDSAHAEIMLLNNPTGLAIDDDKQIMYVADTGNNRILKIDMSTKIATKIAGTGTCEPSPKDGDSSLGASFCSPTWLGFDDQKNLLVIDGGAHKSIRRIFVNPPVVNTLTYYSTNSTDTSFIKKNLDGTFIRSTRDGSQFFFNAAGKHTTSVDRVGNTTQYSYNLDTGYIEQVSDPSGQVSKYFYSGNKISYFQDPGGRQTYFTFTGNFLTSIQFPDNTTKQFEYSPIHGRLVTVSDQKGNDTKINYNELGRLQSIKDPENNITVIDDIQAATNKSPKLGGIGEGKSSSSVKDANNVETRFAEDMSGFIVKYKDGDGRISEIKRDFDGRPLKIIGPDLKSVSLKYTADKFKDLVETTYDATGLKVSQTINSFGQVTTKTDSNTNTTQFNYLATTGLLASKILPSGAEQSFAYNTRGQVVQTTSYPGGNNQITQAFDYDLKGNQIKSIAPDGKINLFEYDSYGNLIKAISYIDANNQSITLREYDKHNRLIKVTSPKLEITSYAYDENGNLNLITDPNSKQTLFFYNKNNQLVKKINNLGFQHIYTYDGVGNVSSESDPNGSVKNFTYTKSNKIKTSQFSDESISFEYDQMDQLSHIDSSSNISVLYTRDDNKRIIQEQTQLNYDSNSYALNYKYDLSGNKTQSVFATSGYSAAVFDPNADPDTAHIQKINYYYDQDNRLSQITNRYGNSFNYSYDNSNRLTSMSRPGSQTDYIYDSGSMLSKMIHTANGDIKSFTELAYDSRNIPIQKRTPAGTFNYNYDANGQLTSASQSLPAGAAESFAYDGIGNRTSDGTYAQTYDSEKMRLQDDGQFIYSYDNNGNILLKNSKTGGISYSYIYSSRNQITEIWTLNAPPLSSIRPGDIIKKERFKYDPLGRRVQKDFIDLVDTTKSFQRKYAYDGQNIIAEFDSQKGLLAAYTHSPLAPDDILSVYYPARAVAIANGGSSENSGNAIAPQAGSFYFLKDNLGSITEIVDGSGNVKQKYQYSTFGSIRSVKDQNNIEVGISNAQFKNSFTYTGREWDNESGLYYYRARYYDPNTGRFLQQDPHPGFLAAPISHVNKYIYGANNPNVFTDPSGMSWISEFDKHNHEWAVDALVAIITIAVIYFSGGTAVGFIDAAAAVGSVAGGAALAAGAMAAGQEGDFWNNFDNNFHDNFRISCAFLVTNVIWSDITAGGIIRAGGNGFNGYTETLGTAYAPSGGVTIGSATSFNGVSSGFVDANIWHEAFHTIQFIAISGGSKNTQKAWEAYIGVGLLGTMIRFAGVNDMYNPIEFVQ